jgi:hypothetical protein
LGRRRIYVGTFLPEQLGLPLHVHSSDGTGAGRMGTAKGGSHQNRSNHGHRSVISCWYLVLQKLFGTTRSAYNVVFAIDEIANWALYFGLTFLYIASLPRWLIDEPYNFLIRIYSNITKNVDGGRGNFLATDCTDLH